MTEIWRDIQGYEGRYQISSLGRVKSLSRNVNNHTGHIKLNECILKQRTDYKGYMRIDIRDNTGVRHYFGIHRLVAQAFIPNPNNKPQVNHINGNKADNRLENLEWCTNSENQKHAYRTGLNHVTGKAGRPKRPVLQIDMVNNKIISEYSSISDAEKITHSRNVRMCCIGKRKSANGYRWKFKESR